MDPNPQMTEPEAPNLAEAHDPGAPPGEIAERRSKPRGIRRILAAVALTVGLLVVGVSATMAASPAPSSSPSTSPSTSSGTTTPTTPHDCPNMGSKPSK